DDHAVSGCLRRWDDGYVDRSKGSPALPRRQPGSIGGTGRSVDHPAGHIYDNDYSPARLVERNEVFLFFLRLVHARVRNRCARDSVGPAEIAPPISHRGHAAFSTSAGA